MTERRVLSNSEIGWWLSFTDAGRPKGHQFLGGCYVHAGSLEEAITVTHLLGINPGGAVKAVNFLAADAPESTVWEKLLSRAEIEGAIDWTDGDE